MSGAERTARRVSYLVDLTKIGAEGFVGMGIEGERE